MYLVFLILTREEAKRIRLQQLSTSNDDNKQSTSNCFIYLDNI